MLKMKTVKLNNGVIVLAKETKYGLNAIGYANRTQANRKSFILRSKGIDCDVVNWGCPFFIRINNQ